jgi:hypothetical protein
MKELSTQNTLTSKTKSKLANALRRSIRVNCEASLGRASEQEGESGSIAKPWDIRALSRYLEGALSFQSELFVSKWAEKE